MFKKILIVLILAIAVFGLWYFQDFLKEKIFSSKEIVLKNETSQNNSESNFSEKTDPSEENYQEDELVVKGQIKMASLMDDEKIIYFNQNNFLETDLSGNQQKNLTTHPFKNLQKINCNSKGQHCLIQEGDKFSVYDLRNKEKRELNENIKTIDFNSQQDGLVYLYQERAGIYELNSSNLLGENWLKLKEIPGENLKITVSPKDNTVAYFSQKAEKEKAGIYLTDLIGVDSGKRVVEKDIIGLNWSLGGGKILFSFYDHSVAPKRVNLSYYDLESEKEYVLGLPGLAQKCAWGKESKEIYCGILANLEQKSFNLSDWHSGEFISNDFFWKIDLVNGDRERFFVKGEEKYPPVDSFNLFILNEELFFVDKISGNLIKRPL